MSALDPQPSRQLYLNSRNASVTTDTTKMSQMTFSLNEPIICPRGYELYGAVVSMEVPNTLFTVDTSTVFTFNFVKSGTTYPLTFTTASSVLTAPAPANTNLVIPTGNYSGSTAPATLATYLSKTAIAIPGAGGDTATFTTTFNTNQSRFIITFYTSANSYTLNISTSGTANSGALVLGFTNNTSFGPAGNTSGTATVCYSNTLPRFFPNYLLIGTNLNTYNQAVGQSKISSLAKIVIDQPYNTYIYYRNWFLYSTRLTNREIGSIEVTLYDEYGNIVNMNGANWSVTIQIDTRKMITADLGAYNF